MTEQPPKKPFDAMRAAFLLLAVILLSELALVIFGAVGCFWLILNGRYEMGACATVGQQAREIFAELLTAILALLLAARGPPSPPPPE